ncbi:3'(2'),5'-bisphosphate nucleotidase CysQ [Aliiroseovarius sp.]|uniref:inositol monophosphatase family protein n=1 Tax=Aliiroseovarius sp. TaxID=1872442 RepID=UPI0026339DB1|nr:3'(2'),5'-bisphosphate nucleotidase CysQ [Aliiroseovarius sp.]
MHDDDLTLLAEAAKEAGALARHHFERDPEVWEKDDGQGPVTEADIAVDTMLRRNLTEARPGYGWLSEETEDGPARLSMDRCFIVDPIDGTRAFIDGAPHWALSLAVATHGRVTAAAIYLPMRDKLYCAARGMGATLNGWRLTASTRTELTGAQVLAAKPALEPWRWKDARVPKMKRNFRSSLAYRLALIGEGRFDAMLTLRQTWEWDVAAGGLIVEEAGGRVTDQTGAPLVFNRKDPRLRGVVAGGTVQPDIVARLQPIP